MTGPSVRTIPLTGLRGRQHHTELILHPQGRTVRVTLAASWLRRLRGMLGRSDEALLITPCRSVHGVGMRRCLDVAYLSAAGAVLTVRRLAPGRMHWPVRDAAAVLEVDPTTAEQWQLADTTHIEVSAP